MHLGQNQHHDEQTSLWRATAEIGSVEGNPFYVEKTSLRPSHAPAHHEVADDYSEDDKEGDDEDPLLVSVPRFRGEAPQDTTRLFDVLKSIREDFARCMARLITGGSENHMQQRLWAEQTPEH